MVYVIAVAVEVRYIEGIRQAFGAQKKKAIKFFTLAELYNAITHKINDAKSPLLLLLVISVTATFFFFELVIILCILFTDLFELDSI